MQIIPLILVVALQIAFGSESQSFILEDNFTNYGVNEQRSDSFQLYGDTTWYKQPVVSNSFTIVPLVASSSSLSYGSVSSGNISSSSVNNNENNSGGGSREETLSNRQEQVETVEQEVPDLSTVPPQPIAPEDEGSLEFISSIGDFSIVVPLQNSSEAIIPGKAGGKSSSIASVYPNNSSQNSSGTHGAASSFSKNENYDTIDCIDIQTNLHPSSPYFMNKQELLYLLDHTYKVDFVRYHWWCDILLLICIVVLMFIVTRLHLNQQVIIKELDESKKVKKTFKKSVVKKFRA